MSQSPETAPAALPYIYKNPFAGSDLVEGDTFGHGADLTQRPGLVVEGRSDDIFETIPNEGIVRSETVDDIDITDNRTPEMGVEDGLFSAEANEISDADQAGRLARMGSFVTSKFVELKTSAQESISKGVKKHPKLVAGMAAFAIIGGAAEQATGETTPINQTETTPALTGEALKQFCLQEGLKVPTVSEAILWFPGSSPENPNPPGRFQTANITPKAIDAMPSECTGQYDRKQYMKVDIQNPTKRKKYYTITRPKWQYINGNADSNNGGGDAVTRQVQASNGLPKAYYYRRTPGPRVTHVRGRLKNTVTEKATGKVIGTKYGTKFSVTPKGGAR